MIVSLIALLSSAAQFQQTAVEQVLDNVRNAVGYSALASLEHGVEMTGSAKYMGTDAKYRFVFTPDGKYLYEIAGPIRTTQAWDGEMNWEVGADGSPMPVYFSDADYQNAMSWLIGHRWLAPDGPYDITVKEEDSDSYILNLKLKNGRINVEVVIDRESWLLKSGSYMDGDIMLLIELSKWEATRGFKLPRRIDISFSSGKGWVEVEEVRAVTGNASDQFKMPSWSLTTDTKYDNTKEGSLDSLRAMYGYIFVKPTINGEDVGWFLIDTGAPAMAVDKKLVERLGAEEFGSWMIIAEGGTVPMTFTKLGDFSLGPATVSGMTYIVLDLSDAGEAIGIVIQALTDPGDVVLTEEFVYLGTLNQMRRYGADVVGVRCDNDGIIPDDLDSVITEQVANGKRVKYLYTIPAFQNPLGWTMGLERRKQVLEVTGKHGIPVFEDDCYADLRFEGEDVTSFHSLDDTGRVVYVGSFSKIIAPGMRMGYLVAPKEVIGRAWSFKAGGAVSQFTALTIAEYMKGGLDQHIEEQNRALAAKRDAMVAALGENFGSSVTWTVPQGGLYVWVKFPEGTDLAAVQEEVFDDGVSYYNGSQFSPTGVGSNYVRLCFGHPTIATIHEGVAEFARILDRKKVFPG